MSCRKLWELFNHTSWAGRGPVEGLITMLKLMWQVASRVSLFSPRGGRHDNYDWMVPLEYLSRLIGLTLNQLAWTPRHPLRVKNLLNHEVLEKLICLDCSMGSSDKARQGGITLVNPNQRGCSRSIMVLSAEEVYYLEPRQPWACVDVWGR